MPLPRPLSALSLTALACIAAAVTLIFTEPVFAKAVISEVHWPGSDLSTSDEWVEIAGSGPGFPLGGPSAGSGTDTTLSGWSLTSVNSSGNEVTLFTFPSGTWISAGQYMIISHYGAAQSRLLSDPAFVSASISLPNTKLLLRLRDPSGQIMDHVDDGVGEPFAGENFSSPLRKSSMERVSLAVPGNDPSNWVTATRVVGWKEGVTVMRGTPGFPYMVEQSSGSSSSQSSTTSSSISSTSSTSSVSSISSVSSSSQVGTPALGCTPPDPFIHIQSGAATGEGKVTLNIQIMKKSTTGEPVALSTHDCSVDFGDGTIVSSCNPSSHTYDRVGSYTITAEVKNPCGDEIVRTMAVTVNGKQTSSSVGDAIERVDESAGAVSPSLTLRTGSAFPFVITAILPNPDGKDADREWVEIGNISDQSASLEGWVLRLPHAKKGKFMFGSISFSLRERKRFLSKELGMTFPNTSGELSLVSPGGQIASTLSWKDPRDGVIIRPKPTSLFKELRGRVITVIDGDTFEVEIASSQSIGIGRTERVRLIGIDAPERHAKDPRQLMLGKRATEFVRDLLQGTTVTLTPGTEERDAYGRLLAYAATEAGDSVQEMILREGLASVYLRFAFAKEAEFIAYQREAQEVGAGVWGVGDGVSLVLAREEVLEEPTKGVQRVRRVPSFAKASEGRQGPDAKASSELVQEDVASTSSDIPVTHVVQTSASSSSRSSKKPKKTSARPRVAQVIRQSSRSSERNQEAVEEINYSPLYSLDIASSKGRSSFDTAQDRRTTPTAADLLGDLIEYPNAALAQGEEVSVNEPITDSADTTHVPLIVLGLAILGTASISGIFGWMFARRRLYIPSKIS